MNGISYDPDARVAADDYSRHDVWRVEIRATEHAIRISGPCPRCGHQVDAVQSDVIVDAAPHRQPEAPGSPADVSAASVIHVVCDCGHAHPGAPPSATGCGAFFAIEVQPHQVARLESGEDGAMHEHDLPSSRQQSPDADRPTGGELSEQEPLEDLFQAVFGLADELASAIGRDEIEARLRRTFREAAQARDQAAAEASYPRAAIVLSRALGVRVFDFDGANPRVEYLLRANTPLPAESSNTFMTTVYGQLAVEVEIWEQSGPTESPELAFNHLIGKAVHKFLQPNLPAGTPIEVSFHVSDTGSLTVRMTELWSGNSSQLDLELSDVGQAEMGKASGTPVTRADGSGS